MSEGILIPQKGPNAAPPALSDDDFSDLLGPSSKAPAESLLTPSKGGTQDELERVRELILGTDVSQKRLGRTEVDRLREIIFGPQMEEYGRRFDDLQREVERLQSDLRLAQDGAGELEKAQTKQLETMEREIRRMGDEIRREVTGLRDAMRTQEGLAQQLLNQMRQQEVVNRRLSDGLTELHNILSKQERDVRTLASNVEDVRNQQERKLESLRREARQSEDNLRVELRRTVDRLEDRKTDRKALATMLMEISTRLETGHDMTGMLEDIKAQSRSQE